MDKQELKPCPFCGGKATMHSINFFKNKNTWDVGSVKYFVLCQERNFDCPGARLDDRFCGPRYSEENAAKYWNTRTPDINSVLDDVLGGVLAKAQRIMACLGDINYSDLEQIINEIKEKYGDHF